MESIRDLLPEYNSGGMDIREAGIQCREMDIRRGRMSSGGKEEANARFNPAEKKKGEIENPPLYRNR